MNSETTPFFNSVTAELTPTSKSRVDVQFKQFKILGLLPVTAPESAKGWLDTTYLDEELRISRGDKGVCLTGCACWLLQLGTDKAAACREPVRLDHE